MKCQAVKHRLSEYLEHDLPTVQHEAIAQHLSRCASCRAEAEALRAAEQALQTLSVLEPAPDLLGDLRRRLAVPPARSIPWAWAGLAAAAAAAALLVWLRPEAKTVTPPTSRPVAPRAEVKRPVPPVVAAAPVPVAPLTPVRRAKLNLPRTVSHLRQPVRNEAPAPSPDPEELPAAPVETVQATDGIILILGDPIPPLAESRCHLELTLADGTRSVYERNVKPGENGQPGTIAIAYEQSAPDTTSPN